MTTDQEFEIKRELRALPDIANVLETEECPDDATELEYRGAQCARLTHLANEAQRVAARIKRFATGMDLLPFQLAENYKRRNLTSVEVVEYGIHYVVKYRHPKSGEQTDTWVRNGNRWTLNGH